MCEHSADQFMRVAIREAHLSLREGNHGFGAVVVRRGKIIAQAHDTRGTGRDPTTHAELVAIRRASAVIGKNLIDCRLYSTQEPCPSCAAALVGAGIRHIGFGCSIAQPVEPGRSRTNVSCREIFGRSGVDVTIETDLLHPECAVLYDTRVRKEVRRLCGASNAQLAAYDRERAAKRLRWYFRQSHSPTTDGTPPLRRAYRLLIERLEISEELAPIVSQSERQIVFHSINFCPTLEACKILGLDTRKVCSRYNEGSTNQLVRGVDSHLSFHRNYAKLRPYAEYCEEIIRYDE